MGSKPIDRNTAHGSALGANASDQALQSGATANQNFATGSRQTLFGTNGRGGTLSGMLDPNSVNRSGLSGSYLANYNTASNDIANNAKNSVGTTLQTLANRGMGKTPAGFSADQMRKAYADAATQRGDLYSGLATKQHDEDVSNFWNASKLLAGQGESAAQMAIQGNAAAASNYANLYGTANNRTPNGAQTALNTIQQIGQIGATAAGA